MVRICSFGRDFLSPRSSRFSVRRALRLLLAARRRWSAGSLRVGLSSVSWEVDGCCGVLLSGWWRDGAALDFLFRWRLGYVAWCLFPSVRRGWEL